MCFKLTRLSDVPSMRMAVLYLSSDIVTEISIMPKITSKFKVM